MASRTRLAEQRSNERPTCIARGDHIIQDNNRIVITATCPTADVGPIEPTSEASSELLRRLSDEIHDTRPDDLECIPTVTDTELPDDDSPHKQPRPPQVAQTQVTDVCVDSIKTREIPEGKGTIEVVPKP